MADASLTDVVKKLDEVKSAVKSGEVATGAERLAAGEAAAEGARADAKRMGIFQGILDSLNIFKGMKTDDKKAKGFFSSLLGGFKWAGLMSSFGSLILTGLSTAFTSLGTSFGPGMIKFFKGASPWALIIAGLSMAIEDGITGYLSADEWGTSKIGAFFGGFFGGDAKGGMKNAFKKAGHFALVGAGIGAMMGAGIFSIPGMIIGGLLGAAVGGILGYIGGEKLAKSFDGIGKWFKKQFDDLILGPIKAVWDFIAPDWAKSVTDTMQWSDLLPPGLTKLFNGEYFTFEMPTFTWTDLFPKFLVDLFNNVTKVAEKQTWSWMDLLPPFLTKFFTGEYAPGKQEFKWQDLVPEFIWKVIEVAKTAWADTPFTWRSLVPNFILKIIDATTPIEGSFSWTDLVPKFITDLVVAGAEESTKTGEFSWKALLPDWMIGAWDSTKGLAGQVGAFDWRAILPKFITDLFPTDGPLTISKGLSALSSFDWRALLPKFIADLFPTSGPLTIAAGLDAVASWNWKSLLPKFIQDFIADPTQLAGDEYKFDWKDLLPEFIRDFFGDKKLDKTLSVVKAFDWKTLLPSFIISIMDGEPIADVAKAFSWKSLLPQWMVDVLGTETGKRLVKTAGFAADWWKALLPSWIVNVLEGKSPFAERNEGADEKKVADAKANLDDSVSKLDMPDFGSMFDLGSLMAPIREKVMTLLDPEQAAFGLGKFTSFLRDTLLNLLPEPTKLAKGGLVGMSPMAQGSLGRAMGLESGGLFTLSQGEMVLDNQAAATFLKAAQLLTGSQVLEQSRMGGGGGAPIIVNNNNVDNSMRSSQTTAVSMPAPTRTNESTVRALQMN
mgnify:FL=1